MSELAQDTDILERDADFATPLRRVAYEAGMLLGLDATRDEQTYHRRRINRQQYWFQGSGTLVGMPVMVSADSTPLSTQLHVGPGIGVDGLGREVLVNEAYCIVLSDWLRAQTETQLREGYNEGTGELWLKVTVRYASCAVGKQPVLARKLNLSTDAVQASRTADSVMLELIPELPPTSSDDRFQPWASHPAVENSAPAEITTAEQNTIDANVANTELHAQMELQARLLYALNGQLDPGLSQTQLEESARLLLARIAITVPDLNSILNADENDPVVDPLDVSVNNMVRPFLTTASQLAYLQRST